MKSSKDKDKKKKPEVKKPKVKPTKESLVQKLDEQDSLLGSLMEENYQVISKVKKKKNT